MTLWSAKAASATRKRTATERRVPTQRSKDCHRAEAQADGRRYRHEGKFASLDGRLRARSVRSLD